MSLVDLFLSKGAPDIVSTTLEGQRRIVRVSALQCAVANGLLPLVKDLGAFPNHCLGATSKYCAPDDYSDPGFGENSEDGDGSFGMNGEDTENEEGKDEDKSEENIEAENEDEDKDEHMDQEETKNEDDDEYRSGVQTEDEHENEVDDENQNEDNDEEEDENMYEEEEDENENGNGDEDEDESLDDAGDDDDEDHDMLTYVQFWPSRPGWRDSDYYNAMHYVAFCPYYKAAKALISKLKTAGLRVDSHGGAIDDPNLPLGIACRIGNYAAALALLRS